MVLILAPEWDPLAQALRGELRRRGRDHAVLGEYWAEASELVWTSIPFSGSITLPCLVVNRPRPAPAARAMLAAAARTAGFEPIPAVVASRRDDALAACAADGRTTIAGRVSHAAEDRIVQPESAEAAIDELLSQGAVLIRTLGPAPVTTALVAGNAVMGATAEAAAATRRLAGLRGLGLMGVTLQEHEGRLWFVDADPYPLVPGRMDETQLEPAARGLAEAFEAAS